MKLDDPRGSNKNEPYADLRQTITRMKCEHSDLVVEGETEEADKLREDINQLEDALTELIDYLMTETETDVTDHLYVPSKEEVDEYKRLYMTRENAEKVLLQEKAQTRRRFEDPLPDWVDEAGLDFFSGDDRVGFRGTHPEQGRAEVFRDRKYYVGETRLITTPHWRTNEGGLNDHVGIWDEATRMYRGRGVGDIPDCKPPLDVRDDWHQIHASFLMPKWASRIAVEVTDVGWEKIQDISHQDARAEGVEGLQELDHYAGNWKVGTPPDYREGFKRLWNEIHGHEAWERNDWIRKVEFSLLTPT